MEWGVSQRGKPLFVLDGYHFNFHKNLKNGITRWVCMKPCKSFIKMNESKEIVESQIVHNHDKENDTVINKQESINKLKRKGSDQFPDNEAKFHCMKLNNSDGDSMTSQGTSHIKSISSCHAVPEVKPKELATHSGHIGVKQDEPCERSLALLSSLLQVNMEENSMDSPPLSRATSSQTARPMMMKFSPLYVHPIDERKHVTDAIDCIRLKYQKLRSSEKQEHLVDIVPTPLQTMLEENEVDFSLPASTLTSSASPHLTERTIPRDELYDHLKPVTEVISSVIKYIYWEDVNDLIDRMRVLKTLIECGHTKHFGEFLAIEEALCNANVIEEPDFDRNEKISHDIKYIFWNDSNKLVERLQWLISSTVSGYTTHANEITDIEKELRKVGIIESAILPSC